MGHYFYKEIKGGNKEEMQQNGIIDILCSIKVTKSNQNLSPRFIIVSQFKKGPLQHMKEKWDQEGALTLSNETKKSTCAAQWETITSTKWRQFCWKNLIHFFYYTSLKKTNKTLLEWFTLLETI